VHLGINNVLRGYSAGRYIDRDMLAAQVEYRPLVWWSLEAALFAGVGEVGPRFQDFDYTNLLRSAGLGPRFNLRSKYDVNLRADFPWGKNGHTLSMGLGEASWHGFIKTRFSPRIPPIPAAFGDR